MLLQDYLLQVLFGGHYLKYYRNYLDGTLRNFDNRVRRHPAVSQRQVGGEEIH